jgi:hypothetical protein
MRKLATGFGAGLVAVLLAWVLELAGNDGPSGSRMTKILAIETIVALVLLGAMVVSVGWGPLFRLKLQNEDYARRQSLIPIVLALSLTVLSAFLLLTPPP